LVFSPTKLQQLTGTLHPKKHRTIYVRQIDGRIE
jgi:hypothetical protein